MSRVEVRLVEGPGASAPTPPLARLKVGTKLMLLVLLPVCVLLGFTGLTALADWRAASQLQDFGAATRLSFATAGVAGQLATERTAAAMVRLRPGAQAQAGLGAAQRDVNQALHQAQDRAAGWNGTVDVAGQLALRPASSWRPCGFRSPLAAICPGYLDLI